MNNSIVIYTPAELQGHISISALNIERETELAWGLRVNVGNFDGRSKTVWFPKSQGDIFKVTNENNEETLHVSFPKWLLKEKGFLNSYK